MLQCATTLHHFMTVLPNAMHIHKLSGYRPISATLLRHTPLLYWLSIRKLKVLHQCDPERSICAPNTKQQRWKHALRVYWQIRGIYG